MDLKTRIKKAQATLETFDAIDRANGFTAPAETGREHMLGCAICALEAAIVHEDWDCATESLLYLYKFALHDFPDVLRGTHYREMIEQ